MYVDRFVDVDASDNYTIYFDRYEQNTCESETTANVEYHYSSYCVMLSVPYRHLPFMTTAMCFLSLLEMLRKS